MDKLKYKKINKEDEQQVRNLINKVLDELERKEFIIPYEECELERLFDESYATLYGAYESEELVGMAQLHVEQDMLTKYKDVLGISEFRVCELGGNLVLSEYKGRGIMLKLMQMQYEIAKELRFDYIMSVAHPDDIGNKMELKRLGLEYIKSVYVAEGHLMNIYLKKLYLK